METVKGALDSAKQAILGASADQAPAQQSAGEAAGTAHKTSEVPQTGTGVVGSLAEAGHRMQEQQGADHAGYYEAQAKVTDALERGKEKMEGSS